jgi:hypothetical protein
MERTYPILLYDRFMPNSSHEIYLKILEVNSGTIFGNKRKKER